MMLADTTLLIDFLRGNPDAVRLVEKMESLPLHTTEINVFELITGVYISGVEEKSHMQKVLGMLSKMTVLPLDRKATMEAGRIAGKLTRKGKRIEETDCLIAGIAIAHGIKKIITANKAHYERIPGIKTVTY